MADLGSVGGAIWRSIFELFPGRDGPGSIPSFFENFGAPSGGSLFLFGKQK